MPQFEKEVDVGYEIFSRKVHRSGTPTLAFAKIGQITFNQAAARILQKEAIESVLLLWDAKERMLAIKTTSNKKDPRAYRIRYADKGNGASFSAKTFMDYIGLDYSERRSVSIEINPNHEMLIETKLPEEFFQKKPLQQPKIVEKGKIA